MLKTSITPSIGDCDAFRHINNNALCTWFENGRNPIFKIFNPTMELTYKKWNLVMLRSDFNYYKRIYFGFEVEIRTYITKIAKTSITVHHEAWQNGQLRADGNCVLLHYDYIREKSMIISPELREQLNEYFITKEELESNNKREIKENISNPEDLDYVESDFR